MTRQDLFSWVNDRYGTTPDYPWHSPNAVLRHKENKKWYAVVLEVTEDKLELPGEELVDVLNVKCEPMLIAALQLKDGFFPAYHMNKNSWISILLDGTVPDEDIKNLLELSFELTKSKTKSTVKQKRGNNHG